MNLLTRLPLRAAKIAGALAAAAALAFAGTGTASAATPPVPAPLAHSTQLRPGAQPVHALDAGALRNLNTGRCIDDSFAYGLRAFGCNGLNYQRWEIYYNGNGTLTFRNENTGRCIDDSGAYGLRSFGCNGMNYQQFVGQ
ncbi:RICIN domain-containing protein [Streptomyces sp. NPDC051994]|uniref:RICIN domain-containing protein n=1 Tax=unclassified Streptomyces TaxID=2593676 RepID=UPI00341FE88D